MGDKKIDKLFKEHLQSFEVTPNKIVWANIETKLKKKKRRVFPFWLFSGSIAAVLVIGLFIFPFSKDKNLPIKINTDQIITTIPKNSTKTENKIDSIVLNKKRKENTFITQKENTFKGQKKKENTNKKEEKKEPNFYNKSIKFEPLKHFAANLNFIKTSQKPIKIAEKLIENSSKKLNKKLDSNKIDINSLVSKKEPKQVDKLNKKQWSIAPIFAILKSNSFTNASPIDANLTNSTEGENSFSFGVQVAYQINKKWTIQSGIHLQETNYTNNQITVIPSSQSNNFTTKFISGNSFSFDEITTQNSASNSLTDIVNSNGNLAQNYGYIEIPIEIKYNFSNIEKFETQIVTGFSSLFLNKNSILLNTQNVFQETKAKNLNAINFSGNLGFDFNYLIDKNWSLNVNPMLKIQLNTFKENANGFSPFNMGIYSGIKYSF